MVALAVAVVILVETFIKFGSVDVLYSIAEDCVIGLSFARVVG